jgi:hypothetical protein
MIIEGAILSQYSPLDDHSTPRLSRWPKFQLSTRRSISKKKPVPAETAIISAYLENKYLTEERERKRDN